MWEDPQEAVAEMDSHRKVYLVRMLFLPGSLIICHQFHSVCCYDFTEIIKCKTRPYLLDDKLGLAAVEIDQPYGIFQFPEGSLHTPYADILEMPILGSLKYLFYNALYIYRHFLL